MWRGRQSRRQAARRYNAVIAMQRTLRVALYRRRSKSHQRLRGGQQGQKPTTSPAAVRSRQAPSASWPPRDVRFGPPYAMPPSLHAIPASPGTARAARTLDRAERVRSEPRPSPLLPLGQSTRARADSRRPGHQHALLELQTSSPPSSPSASPFSSSPHTRAPPWAPQGAAAVVEQHERSARIYAPRGFPPRLLTPRQNQGRAPNPSTCAALPRSTHVAGGSVANVAESGPLHASTPRRNDGDAHPAPDPPALASAGGGVLLEHVPTAHGPRRPPPWQGGGALTRYAAPPTLLLGAVPQLAAFSPRLFKRVITPSPMDDALRLPRAPRATALPASSRPVKPRLCWETPLNREGILAKF